MAPSHGSPSHGSHVFFRLTKPQFCNVCDQLLVPSNLLVDFALFDVTQLVVHQQLNQ